MNKSYYFIDDSDLAQELTKDAVIELAKQYGKDIVDHIFIEEFTEADGIQYIPLSKAIKTKEA